MVSLWFLAFMMVEDTFWSGRKLQVCECISMSSCCQILKWESFLQAFVKEMGSELDEGACRQII